MAATPDTAIRNVSDTALWVALYRAMESERPDALFRDPYARSLAGERGEAIVQAMPHGANLGWPMVVRTVVIDALVERCVREHGIRTILNLAAGLDTRPYRLDLPAGLAWLHVDMPVMVDYMRTGMQGEAPRCRLEYHAADLRQEADRKTLWRHPALSDPTLVISEGLLVYLEPDAVAALARDLRGVPAITAWVTDLASPALRKLMARQGWLDRLESSQAAMRFFPQEGTDFFTPFGWREVEFHSTVGESWRLKRSFRGAGLYRFLSRLMPRAKRENMLRMSGIVLLRPNHVGEEGQTP